MSEMLGRSERCLAAYISKQSTAGNSSTDLRLARARRFYPEVPDTMSAILERADKQLDHLMDSFTGKRHLRLKVLCALIVIVAACFLFHYWDLVRCLMPWKACATDTIETHAESFSVHALAVSLELLLGFMIIEIVWKHHERKEREQQKREERERLERERRRQLRYIKSHMFQSPMLTLFQANFRALEPSSVTITNILNQSYCPDEVRTIAYKADDELKGRAILEYFKAEKEVWQKFLELGILFGFGQVVVDMTEILRLIQRVRNLVGEPMMKCAEPAEIVAAIRRMDSNFLQELENRILKPGVLKFIDYVEELRSEDPGLLESLLACYARHDGFQHVMNRNSVLISQSGAI